MNETLQKDDLELINAYWRAANYLSIGQIYLLANPLLKQPLAPEHIKPRLLGHWGTTPGLNFVYAHVNRLINRYDLNAIFVTGPGHGGPALVANTYLEGSYTAMTPEIGQDLAGLQRLFKQFSFPGGIPSHVAPEVPGSINEGGELGYSLAHAFGAVLDNPDLLAVCVVGDGEAETGPLATSWHANKFLNPRTDGQVLPVLHLNGYKISGPTVLARLPEETLTDLFRGYGYEPRWVEGSHPPKVHQDMAAALESCLSSLRSIKGEKKDAQPLWPMIILRTPKGWTGPKEVDGKQIEGTFRAHQVPLTAVRENPEHLRELEAWLKSYRPEELFTEQGRLKPEFAGLAPSPERRMGSNPHANGGVLLRPLHLPDFRSYAVKVDQPGATQSEATGVFGKFLRDIFRFNEEERNFLLFCPDETASNHLDAVFEVTARRSSTPRPDDDHLSTDGRVFEVLSEHLCQGWIEGYLLTGRHGIFSCYEAFIHIIDSMFNQYAKWLKSSRAIAWRRPVASLNYLLTSHVWRQDHNGFSHQDPGFIDHIVNKKAEIVRVYLPPDANCLLSVGDHCLRSRNYVNLMVAGKHPTPNWLPMEAAVRHCTAGLGIWDWASNDRNQDPDVVMACCGDVPTLETLAAVDFLRQNAPEIAIRVVNVVDLMTLQSHEAHPHGLLEKDFEFIFTTDRPVIFAFHGYPWLVHRLTYKRINHQNFHVRGYNEEGTTTTPFDMTVLNRIDRFHLAADVLDRISHPPTNAAYLKQVLRDKLLKHREYVTSRGDDLPEVKNWQWPYPERAEVV